MRRARPLLIVVGVICSLCSAAAIAIYALYFARHPLQDWMVYYASVRSWFDGNLPLIFDGDRFTALLDRQFSGWLHEPLDYRFWAYPPTFLLLLLPFGLLGFAFSCVLFEAATLAALLAALWRWAGDRHRLLYVLSLLLAPATWFNLAVGQNGFLTAALLVGGMALLPLRPVIGGAILGLLSYKPQFLPLVPIALLAARQWRALIAMSFAAVGAAAASLAVFGEDAWRLWVMRTLSPPPIDAQRFLDCCRLHDESVFTNLSLLGLPPLAADFGQVAAAVLAAGAVWWSWRHPLACELRLAVLLAAMTLMAPHFANYDAVLLVIAATSVFAHGLDHGFCRGQVVVPLLVWTIQLFNPPDVFRLGELTPVLTLLLIALAIARSGEVIALKTAAVGSASRLTGGGPQSSSAHGA